MAIHVQIFGLEKLRRKDGTLQRDVEDEVSGQIHREANEIETVAHARAETQGRIGARAGRTVRTQEFTTGAAIYAAGRTRTLGNLLFKGAEFGGRRRRKSHIGRRGDTLYLIRRRRTTMMFRAHVGTVGYFYYPAIRGGLRGIHVRIGDAVGRGYRK